MISKYVFAFALIFIMLPVLTFSQVRREKIFFDLNRSRHGSGDMEGLSIGLQYNRGLSKRFDWYGDLGFSMYDLSYQESNPNVGDETYEQRYVTAGLQIGGGVAYKPLAAKNEINIQLGPILRYQSSSLAGSASTYYPDLTGLPMVVEHVKFYGEPLRTFNLGAKLRLGYSYVFTKGLLLGANVYLQTDTYGDTIHGYGITVGKRMN
ncbi:hypothetical protein ABDK00_003020 [Niabella insulamsoli]|uniref:hypothetical protein n=1 Tax=Niabella insulamsoli TaxID=3144874 RepID=UPI0031FC779E